MPRPKTNGVKQKVTTIGQPEKAAPIDWLPDKFERRFGHGSPIGSVYCTKDGYKTLQGKVVTPYTNIVSADNNEDRAAIMKLLSSSGQKWTASEIAKETAFPALRVSRGLQQLLRWHLINKEGKGTTTIYFCK